MYSKQNLPATRFSKSKTCFSYFIAGHYLMCSSLAYTGPGTFENDLELDLKSKKIITRSLNKASNETQENPENSLSSPSPFRSTLDWMHESALSGCDRFSRWLASYAKDIPPAYFAQSLLEVDYANDALFWQRHFDQELEDIKKIPYLGLQERAQLKDLQELVWNGVLSPYVYEKGLRELGKKSLFSKVKSLRGAFQSELKENPEFVLQHLRKDLANSLEGMQNNRKGSEQTLFAKLEKRLTYYSNVMNAFDYGETLAGICLRMEENKGKLGLSTTQHEGFMESLSNQLHKINKKQYFHIKAEREAIRSAQKESIQETKETQQGKKPAPTTAADPEVSSKFLEEDNTSASLFSYPLSLAKSAGSLVQRGVRFTLENPTQAITMGVAMQAAAVAAASAFGLPSQNARRSSQLKRLITDTESNQANQNNNINLGSLTAAQGFTISGATIEDQSAWSVASAGDFNGDGLNDVIIGAPYAPWVKSVAENSYWAGKSYVIYGNKNGVGSLNLGSLRAAQGLTISGTTANDQSGWSVASAGDFNGDGLGDVIIGAPQANGGAENSYWVGKSYVIYGTNTAPASMSLGSLTAAQGLTINGGTAGDFSGYSVASAGDFNGDGLGDVIIGAPYAPWVKSVAGKSYVIYGTNTAPASMSLGSLTAAQGLTISGATAGDQAGVSVASAGDFNGDGLNDAIIGASGANREAGKSYVIYGTNATPANMSLGSLTAAQGLTISGVKAGDFSGISVASAGDFNGDGISDVIIGAPGFYGLAGKSYVIYGTNTAPASMSLSSLRAAQGFPISGAARRDRSGWPVASAGDFNGDGLGDVIIGAQDANREAGKSYVIYGTNATPANMSLGSLTAAQGFTLSGVKAGDQAGWPVASAGDFNGDGLGDVIIGAPHANNYAGKSYVIYGNYIPTNPTPYIIGVSSGVAVVGILSVSVGLAVTYRDRIRNWIRSYTPLDKDINDGSHEEEVVGQDRTDKDINSESRGEEVEAVELDRTDENH